MLNIGVINSAKGALMAHLPNTTAGNTTFTQDVIDYVWEKANVDVVNNPDEFRRDNCGAWIRKADYGDTDSEYGWEIDHIQPVNLGGTDNLDNLEPLHWKNNRGKSDDYPHWHAAVTEN